MIDDDRRDDDLRDSPLRDVDLAAWDVPPPRADLADAVVARMSEPEGVSPVTSMLEVPPRRRWWLVGGVAAAVVAVVVIGTIVITGSRRDEGGHDRDDHELAQTEAHDVIASRAQHLELEGITAELDPDSALRWRRTPDMIRVEQTRGSVSWKVGAGRHLVIDPGAMGASIDATGASLRVEVHMNHADSRVIAGSAITAAVAAVVTVVAYEGHIGVRNAGQTIAVAPGASVEIRPNEPPRETPVVGVGTRVALDLHSMMSACWKYEIARDYGAMRECAREFRRAHPDDTEDADHMDQAATAGLEAKHALDQIEAMTAAGNWREARKLGDDQPIGSPLRIEIEEVLAAAPCGAADLVSSARLDMARGLEGSALRKLETTMACQPSPETDKLALISACSVRGEIHAGAYLATRARHESTTIDALCGRITPQGPKTVEPPCDDDLLRRGNSYFSGGQYSYALDMYERVYACKLDRGSAALARVAACKVHDETKAREYRDLAEPDHEGEAPCRGVQTLPTYAAPSKPCDVDKLREAGTRLFGMGMFRQALASFEQALACKPSSDLTKLAYTAACNGKDVPKARLYFQRLAPQVQHDVSVICARNGIQLDSPEPSCDVEALSTKGMTLFNEGEFAMALHLFDEALGCKQVPDKTRGDLVKRGFLAACNARNTKQAKRFFAMLTPQGQKTMQVVCIRNSVPVQ